jgi:hypothetical protein
MEPYAGLDFHSRNTYIGNSAGQQKYRIPWLITLNLSVELIKIS